MPIIDNPGAGNCGFYAFSVGLIDIIQNELRKNGSSPTLHRLNLLVRPEINSQTIAEFDLTAFARDYRTYQRDFLNTLQHHLRTIALRSYIEHLNQQYERYRQQPCTQIEGTMIFDKFMQVVHSKLNKKSISSFFNELVLSSDVNRLAQSVLTQLVYNDNPLDWTEFKQLTLSNQEKCLRESAKKVFLSDIYSSNQQVKADSKILEASKKITDSGHWATHQDLQSVAAALQINLNINRQFNGKNLEDAPTITLNNHGNAHWTTSVEPISVIDSSLSGSKPETNTSNLLSQKACAILLAMISAVESEEKREQFKITVSEILSCAQTLSVDPEYQIDIDKIDTALSLDEEEDGAFAARLQEAEFRKAGLKR